MSQQKNGDGLSFQFRKAEPTVQPRQTDKNSPEKSGFDFLGEFVLAEGLGGGDRQHEKRSRLFSPFKCLKIRQFNYITASL
jgi:hypothetical protein